MLRIMTLNLNYHVDKHGPWPARREEIAACVAQAAPDMVALQAVEKLESDRDQAEELAQLLPDFHYRVFSEAMAAPDGERGQAFLARDGLQGSDAFRLSMLPGLEDANARIVLQTTFKGIRIHNAHLSWVPEQAARNVDELVSRIDDRGAAALLVGDFNCAPDSDALQRLLAHGWVDIWGLLRAGEPGHTFEAPRPSQRIDYVLARPALAERAIEIQTLSAPDDAGCDLSDHFGVMACFDWPSG